MHYRCPDVSLSGSARELQGRVRVQTSLGHLGKERVVYSLCP